MSFVNDNEDIHSFALTGTVATVAFLQPRRLGV